ncbi:MULTISPECIES: YfzA family protein [Paenibacillus]|uniref:YfzA-like protein n=1 Tax=Paenibacillus campinasensis TaxID=66347 RepID=A0A268EEL9_9BACL|nr:MULTISPECIES: YfzA family protein [Paenibacillus]MUG67058.1 hypothetical protein [Paenibacillus campinasensis]PAD71562.1 hypothetical protein CHH67_24155 [Paenibacillus campinasensis]PAK50751.1 hypothetical protein CHH75_16075 [Paenibacillus sp. 7541]
MSGTEQSVQASQVKKWLSIIAVFIVFQLIFFAVDGTFLEPRINDSNNWFAQLGRWILDSKLFTEWITPYSYPFFNMFMTVQVISILVVAVQDIKSAWISKT